MIVACPGRIGLADAAALRVSINDVVLIGAFAVVPTAFDRCRDDAHRFPMGFCGDVDRAASDDQRADGAGDQKLRPMRHAISSVSTRNRVMGLLRRTLIIGAVLEPRPA